MLTAGRTFSSERDKRGVPKINSFQSDSPKYLPLPRSPSSGQCGEHAVIWCRDMNNEKGTARPGTYTRLQ